MRQAVFRVVYVQQIQSNQMENAFHFLNVTVKTQTVVTGLLNQVGKYTDSHAQFANAEMVLSLAEKLHADPKTVTTLSGRVGPSVTQTALTRPVQDSGSVHLKAILTRRAQIQPKRPSVMTQNYQTVQKSVKMLMTDTHSKKMNVITVNARIELNYVKTSVNQFGPFGHSGVSVPSVAKMLRETDIGLAVVNIAQLKLNLKNRTALYQHALTRINVDFPFSTEILHLIIALLKMSLSSTVLEGKDNPG